ncbi:MAG: YkgJ family cysteine cluster protein [Pseudomonadales bacterium]|nr:YkgJ family cysteine cluster protein [Pseudomonadales bacterium]
MKECNQCGKCCKNYSDGGLSATASEIEYWEIFRPEIRRYVRGGNIWMDPETGAQLKLCPWLRQVDNQEKYTCDIYHDRPDDCKHYPVRVDEMIRDKCEMIEAKDLLNQKEAQKLLDILMVDSRPPVA